MCDEIGAIDPADDAEHALIEKFAQCQIHILPNILLQVLVELTEVNHNPVFAVTDDLAHVEVEFTARGFCSSRAGWWRCGRSGA